MATSSSKTIYFGYGSNLWQKQMRLRCPKSTYLGISRLPNWKWVINDRGYANVTPTESKDDEVWGLVYELTAADEKALDRNEGVPHIYVKVNKTTEFWHADADGKANPNLPAQKKEMLVYVDEARQKPSQPKDEYVVRMNNGIDDALAAGVPQAYIDNVLRKFIPKLEEEDGATQELAQRQAESFEDE